MKPSVTIKEIIEILPELRTVHSRTCLTYALFSKLAHFAVKDSRFVKKQRAIENLGKLGDVELPYLRMGAVDSLDLFGLDELIIFAFYLTNRKRYRRAADIGANLGLHSIIMSRCGWSVKAYEPDPFHAAALQRNLNRNRVSTVELILAAVSDRNGEMEFVRVLGNTTSSHLAGAKPNPYGKLNRFPVKVASIGEIMVESDFIKMDAEGQEKIIILGTKAHHWTNVEMILEVGSDENAHAIFTHLKKLRLNGFAQKIGWNRVQSISDMPISYKDGSLFITRARTMPWNGS